MKCRLVNVLSVVVCEGRKETFGVGVAMRAPTTEKDVNRYGEVPTGGLNLVHPLCLRARFKVWVRSPGPSEFAVS